VLSYGGGLVGGDEVSLEVGVGEGASLVMLSQGSTKVFKDRFTTRSHIQRRIRPPDPNPSASISPSPVTCQRMTVRVSKGATLYLFPDPVTCFKHASYNQLQTFHLENDASLIVLDSFTSGRKSLGEEWEFWRYYSVNDIWVNGQRVARDVMLLEQEKEGEVKKDSRWNGALPARTLADRLAPYSCYATAILYGPAMHETLRDVSQRCDKISVFKQASPPPLLWSFSWAGPKQEGGVIRVAAVDTEGVRNFLKELLHMIKPVVGIDTYHKAFP